MPHIPEHEDVPIQDVVGDLVNAPSLPAGTEIVPELLKPGEGEFLQDAPTLDTGGLGLTAPTIAAPSVESEFGIADAIPTITAPTVDVPTQLADTLGITPEAAQFLASIISPDQLQQIIAPPIDVEATTAAGVSPSEAAQVDPSLLTPAQIQESLVSTELGKLLDFKAGDVPKEFKGAVLEATALANARGLGASTIAAEAIAAGLVNAALPIAQGNADIRLRSMLSNQGAENAAKQFNATSQNQVRQFYDSLNTQINLFNASELNRIALETSITQAQLDFATQNANAQQQLQAALSNQAAQNVAKQFNAASRNQVQQFYDSLSAQIDQFNATETNRINLQTGLTNAQLSINAQITNAQNSLAAATTEAELTAASERLESQLGLQAALESARLFAQIEQFNSTLKDARERFNIDNQLIIDQSNTQWRRVINTANTAEINAANQANAANLLNLSNFALSALWQEFRDEAFWSYTSGENQLDRAHNLAIAAFDRQTLFDTIDEQQEAALFEQIGQFALNLIGNL